MVCPGCRSSLHSVTSFFMWHSLVTLTSASRENHEKRNNNETSVLWRLQFSLLGKGFGSCILCCLFRCCVSLHAGRRKYLANDHIQIVQTLQNLNSTARCFTQCMAKNSMCWPFHLSNHSQAWNPENTRERPDREGENVTKFCLITQVKKKEKCFYKGKLCV